MKPESAVLKSGVFIAGIVLFLMSFQVAAETWTSLSDRPQVAQYPIWVQDPYTSESVLTYVKEPNTSLWNAKRITDYQESLEVETAPPLGVLTIAKLDIQVPIYNGTDEFQLNRGAGRIKGMAKMDEEGNLGVSGHRDGFFRGLKDIKPGDDIEILTTNGVETYAVTDITIVDKSDISILEKTDEKKLTLVTCYPFYFVGHAPKRYIVHAKPKG